MASNIAWCWRRRAARRSGLGLECAQVAPDMAVHQLQNGVANLAQGRVVRGLDDAHVKGQVALDLRFHVVGGESGIERVENLAQALAVGVRGVAGSQTGGIGFDQFANV